MAKRYEGKVLFSIFIDGEDELAKDLKTLIEEDFFPPSATARENANNKFDHDPRVEQIGFYYDEVNNRGILTGVADGYDLVEITEDGQPQLVGMDSGASEVVQAFMVSIVEHTGLGKPIITWLLTLLEPLNNGLGPLHIGGMGGIQGAN